MRPSGRNLDEMRTVSMETGVSKHAEGSCFICVGDTQVLCTASVDEKVPGWMRGSGKGWVTAEYGMLPRATGERMAREAARGKQSGRTQEIQRLIGRSLRAVVDLEGLGEVQIKVDCDVIQADGGTRTASITGGFVALYAALQHMQRLGVIGEIPVASPVAAVSCGVFRGETVLDLDYLEDSTAMADANFVLSGDGGIVEIQATAEEEPFGDEAFAEMMRLARKGVAELTALQADALGISEVAPEEESASEDEKPDTAST